MLPLHEGIAYGPVRSRRLGYSLGINILPRHQKICTFNCGYCEYGWTPNSPGGATSAIDAWPSPVVIARGVAAALQRLNGHPRPARLTLSGHGEPTLHPQFGEVVAALKRVRDALAPGTPLAILSNSSTSHSDSVRDALNQLDERYMKLDAGDETLIRRVNATTLGFEHIVDGLRRVPDIVIQTMFVRDGQGRIDNSTDLSVATWIAAVAALRPRAVHVYTLDRAAAWPYLQPVSAGRLHEIARRAQAAGLAAEVYVAPGAATANARR